MTIEKYLRDRLEQHGMFPEQAEKVVSEYKTLPYSEAMEGRWGHEVEGYPASLLGILIVGTFDHAVKWTEENCPKAWFLPLLRGEESA